MKSDLDRCAGTWIINELEVEGQPIGQTAIGGAQIMVNGSHFSTASMGAEYSGTVSLDENKSPKWFTLKFASGPEKGNTALGIYELNGDTWRICLTITAKERPKEFKTSPGSGTALETLTRGAAETRRALPIADMAAGRCPDYSPVPELEGAWSMLSGVANGHPIEQSMLKSARRVARGNELTVSFGKQVYIHARFGADASRNPKEIDYFLTGGGSAGQRQLGIYELDGDVLRQIFSAPGLPRPVDFTTKAGDGRTLAVWKRLRK